MKMPRSTFQVAKLNHRETLSLQSERSQLFRRRSWTKSTAFASQQIKDCIPVSSTGILDGPLAGYKPRQLRFTDLRPQLGTYGEHWNPAKVAPLEDLFDSSSGRMRMVDILAKVGVGKDVPQHRFRAEETDDAEGIVELVLE
ncbi:hypothetical protein KC343_g6495 [Hortaea werneckii]|nr:hypothetical protein KC352_g15315 [Hortaea werneckii]KAI7565021.1 hypothetical protein KC317_g6651 [Hortaea werneckii]KAI7615705.1 hypothetical protein KC346_g6343 [Hortaea werneckii]KAI7625844.1 hypothetical protein KC343_g6495 [Hortaea werneckii]KAI7635832.1 hypothetical protein KC319_g15388 [Hortaea werneckii]